MNYVLGFDKIDKAKIMIVGGKGANLGELFKIEGISVPDGFCISTEAFKRTINERPYIKMLIDKLSLLKTGERDKISELSAEIRRAIEESEVPEDIKEEVSYYLFKIGEHDAYAIRSSATSEDLPTASFAGQQDTYLNIVGKESIYKHITKCWASMFTERSVMYRLQNGFDHHNNHLAVIVQKMVFPQSSGVMFTADPITSNRKVLSIDASFGLGETLVSGLVNPDIYKVSNSYVVFKNISSKKLAIFAVKDGGTEIKEVEEERQNIEVLTDEQILQLERIGRSIEGHFGSPQDIEWCFSDGKFYIVQSRPITTLYPIPEPRDNENRVYLSVGHQQMMTDPLKPLGMSLFRLTSYGPRFEAGGRLFVDVTQILESPDNRETLIATMGQHDPLTKDVIMTIIERGDFIKSMPNDNKVKNTNKNSTGMSWDFLSQFENNPSIVSDLIKSSQESIEELIHKIQGKSGEDLINFILDDIQQLKKILFDPKSSEVINVAIYALTWINEKMEKWLGEKNAADILSQSVENNITSEMGMALLDVADVIRNFPEVINYLQHIKDDNFLDTISDIDGGPESREAILSYLKRYGMRCVGEIDITKTRWSEKPSALVPIILSNIKNFEPNFSKNKFEQGKQEALKKEQELLNRLKKLPDGEQKADEAKRMIKLFRDLIGYREYPKYGFVNRYFVYKQALLKEAEQLVKSNVIQEKEDIYYLSLEELREIIVTSNLDYQLIRKRKDEYKYYEKLAPPRVITSDGEIITGEYKRDSVPPRAIVGLPVSSGVVEGRARVIFKMEDANLEDGDILVTSFTDPSWTPLFISVKGIITEVGGLMTHGAVIAREYGLPAVVGVEKATKLIKDGQRIRVNGTKGYIEIL